MNLSVFALSPVSHHKATLPETGTISVVIWLLVLRVASCDYRGAGFSWTLCVGPSWGMMVCRNAYNITGKKVEPSTAPALLC